MNTVLAPAPLKHEVMDMESSGASTGAAAAVSSSDVASSTGSSRTTGGADPARDAAAARKEREGRAAAAALRAAQDADPAYAGLSKNARKKLARKQNADVDWRERKRQKKEQKRQRSAENGEKARAALAALPEEEREKRRLQAWERRKAEDAKATAWQEDVQSTPFRCVIDLGFEEKMYEREVKSLIQQVLYSYGANRRASTPWQIHLTSLRPGSLQATQIEKLSGFRSWAGVTAHAEDYITLTNQPRATPSAASAGTAAAAAAAAAAPSDSPPPPPLFPKERLVYLTADSPHEIDVIAPSDVYILGGIVDRNRYPGITYEQAIAQGIRTARLPLGEHVKLLNGTSVLTVNHMVDILLYATKGYAQQARRARREQAQAQDSTGSSHGDGDGDGDGECSGGGNGGAVDWKAALMSALPPRKGVAATPAAADAGDAAADAGEADADADAGDAGDAAGAGDAAADGDDGSGDGDKC